MPYLELHYIRFRPRGLSPPGFEAHRKNSDFACLNVLPSIALDWVHLGWKEAASLRSVITHEGWEN